MTSPFGAVPCSARSRSLVSRHRSGRSSERLSAATGSQVPSSCGWAMDTSARGEVAIIAPQHGAPPPHGCSTWGALLWIDRHLIAVIADTLHELPTRAMPQTDGWARSALEVRIPERAGDLFKGAEEVSFKTLSAMRRAHQARGCPRAQVRMRGNRRGFPCGDATPLIAEDCHEGHGSCIAVGIRDEVFRCVSRSTGAVV
jgi:hypothetical protein